MGFVPLRRTRLNQPTGDGIDWSNPFTKKLSVLFVGGDGREIVNGVQFLKSGSPLNSVGQSGRCLSGVNGGASYDGFYPPETSQNSRSDKLYAPVAPPITLFVVGSGKSGSNLGAGLVRGNGSGTPAFALSFWDGTFRGASVSVRTSGGSISVTTPTTSAPNSVVGGTHVAVAVIGKTTTTVYCDGFQKDTFSTPSGNFYYEHNDQYRCLSVGGAYSYGGGDVAMCGAIFGEEWSEKQARDFIANPWQIFQ